MNVFVNSIDLNMLSTLKIEKDVSLYKFMCYGSGARTICTDTRTRGCTQD